MESPLKKYSPPRVLGEFRVPAPFDARKFIIYSYSPYHLPEEERSWYSMVRDYFKRLTKEL